MKDEIDDLRVIIEELEDMELGSLANFYRDRAIQSLEVVVKEIEKSVKKAEDESAD